MEREAEWQTVKMIVFSGEHAHNVSIVRSSDVVR